MMCRRRLRVADLVHGYLLGRGCQRPYGYGLGSESHLTMRACANAEWMAQKSVPGGTTPPTAAAVVGQRSPSRGPQGITMPSADGYHRRRRDAQLDRSRRPHAAEAALVCSMDRTPSQRPDFAVQDHGEPAWT